ncbi:MAG: amine oxidase [Sediminibacterium sp.]|nr:amine oxidase [Sediminibacterium sp.]
MGAGATGLMAANELADTYSVILLEALDRVGGRIHTIYSTSSGDPIEAGAEFIHGKLPISFSLARKAGATLEEVTGNMYKVTGCEWKLQEEMIEGWDELLKQMESIPEDITLDAFLETHFSEPAYEALRRHTRAYAAGFDLADSVSVSVKALHKEWSQKGEEQYRIINGYQSITNYLQRQCEAKGCTILVNKTVKQVDWEKNRVTVYTADNEKHTADKAIITLPAGILQQKVAACSINITPPLDEYDAAWQKIGYGSVMKIVLRFKKAFWKSHQEDIGFIFSEEISPTWWTQLPSDIPLLTGWVGGPSAVQWDLMDDETIVVHAVTSLAHIFGMTTEEVVKQLSEHHILRWHALPAAGGAYSFETPLSGEAKKLLSTPIEDTLYFAGEALYSGPYPGTVEAALHCGMKIAKYIQGEK